MSIKITFIYNNEKKTVEAEIGDNILQLARKHNIPIEGACEGSLACSTCHVIVDEQHFCGNAMKKSMQEEDMLDFAFGLQPTSRLGCQLIVEESMDGATLIIPKSRNYYG